MVGQVLLHGAATVATMGSTDFRPDAAVDLLVTITEGLDHPVTARALFYITPSNTHEVVLSNTFLLAHDLLHLIPHANALASGERSAPPALAGIAVGVGSLIDDLIEGKKEEKSTPLPQAPPPPTMAFSSSAVLDSSAYRQPLGAVGQ